MWTYSGNPASSAKDEVRFLVGDTDTNDQLVSDEEIAFVLGVHADSASINYAAAAVVAEGIAAKFARKMDKSVGSLSVQAKQQRDHYVELARDLRRKGGLSATGSYGVPKLSGGGESHLMGNWT